MCSLVAAQAGLRWFYGVPGAPSGSQGATKHGGLKAHLRAFDPGRGGRGALQGGRVGFRRFSAGSRGEFLVFAALNEHLHACVAKLGNPYQAGACCGSCPACPFRGG